MVRWVLYMDNGSLGAGKVGCGYHELWDIGGCCGVVSQLGFFVARITLVACSVMVIVPNFPKLCLILAGAMSLERHDYAKVFTEGNFDLPEVRMPQ